MSWQASGIQTVKGMAPTSGKLNPIELEGRKPGKGDRFYLHCHYAGVPGFNPLR